MCTFQKAAVLALITETNKRYRKETATLNKLPAIVSMLPYYILSISRIPRPFLQYLCFKGKQRTF